MRKLSTNPNTRQINNLDTLDNTMETNNQQFNQRDVSIEEKISRLIDKKLTELQNSVDEMDTRVLDQLDTIEEKLDSMEEKLNNLEELLN